MSFVSPLLAPQIMRAGSLHHDSRDMYVSAQNWASCLPIDRSSCLRDYLGFSYLPSLNFTPPCLFLPLHLVSYYAPRQSNKARNYYYTSVSNVANFTAAANRINSQAAIRISQHARNEGHQERRKESRTYADGVSLWLARTRQKE